MRRVFVFLGSLLSLSAPAWGGNVILFVGDGTGLAQIAAARIAAVGPDGRLAMDGLEERATMTTHAADALTTDSAAGATAWSTGRKTNNKYLAVDPQGRRLTTVLEYARDAGLGTGLVTTTTLTHATPAAFAAHINNRNAYPKIATMMLETRPHIMLGGGRDDWTAAQREDGRDLLAEARRAGYRIVEDRAELLAVDPGQTPYLLGLFAPGHLSYRYDREGDREPSLAEMTQVAIDALQVHSKGFLLVVEGGRVDHGGHSNDTDRTVWETIALDRAIARGIEFAAADAHTLVIFVADHETGGMSVANGYYEGFPEIPQEDGFPRKDVSLEETLRIQWTTTGHTGIPVIAAAMGPGAGAVRGVMDNTELFGVIMKGLGLEAVEGG